MEETARMAGRLPGEATMARGCSRPRSPGGPPPAAPEVPGGVRSGSLEVPHPVPDGAEQHEAEEARGRVVVARGHAAAVLQLVDEALDPAPERVEAPADRAPDLAA